MLAVLLSAAVVAGAPAGFTKVAFFPNPPKPVCTLESQSGQNCTYRCPDGSTKPATTTTTCPSTYNTK